MRMRKLSAARLAVGLLVVASPLWAEGAIVVEQVPRPPGAGYHVWRPGYWNWTGVRYLWIPGMYLIEPRPGVVWVPGHWVARDRGWVWAGGYWRR